MGECGREFRALPGIEIFRFTGLTDPFPPHFHKRFLLGALLSGERFFSGPGGERKLQPGELVALAPFQAHSCRPVSGPCSWVCLHIEPNLGERLSAGAQPALDRDTECGRTLETLVDNLLVCGEADPLMPALAGLFRKAFPPGANGASRRPDSFEALLSKMEELAVQTSSLEEMAARAGMGEYAFLRAFFRKTGITPWRYVQSCRLHLGQELLRSGQAPVEAALKAGYFDQSHFTRAFKASLGLTPGFFGGKAALARRV